jgi:glycosyltransferase involved in cell wall biosynthesis
MKILFVSMHSIHSTRWIENLKDSEHELYWFDISNQGKIDALETVNQISGWKKRKLPYIKGEYWLSKKFPKLYKSIHPYLETTENEAIEKIIQEIKPDVVHSFEMHAASYPIVKTMNKYPKFKWLYSCWGNDLFYYQDFPYHKNRIQKVLKRVNYLHADCQRDYPIAYNLGFKGTSFEMIPTGGGFKIQELETYKKPIEQRKIILVKGYHHEFGRALNVIKALERLKDKINPYEVVIFGAHAVVQNYVDDNNLKYKVYGRHDLSHQKILELMGKSLLYVGNNISDGMANTLLEAIIMRAFPIQSNPGNVSAEIIEDGVNGLLINDPENIDSIAALILKAIDNPEMLESASKINEKIAIERLDYSVNQQKIATLYRNLEKSSATEE